MEKIISYKFNIFHFTSSVLHTIVLQDAIIDKKYKLINVISNPFTKSN